MNKQDFLAKLSKGLSGLPEADIKERLAFYAEMIDDRMEDGISEEDAVGEIGSIDEIISQTVADIPLAKLVKEKITPKKKLKAWEIVFLALGSPIWLSLLIAAFAVAFAFYISLWAVIVSLWGIFVSLAACGLAGAAAGTVWAFGGNFLTGIAAAGAGIFSAGLSVFAFFGCKAVTRWILIFSKKLALRIKHCFVKKEVS